MTRPNRPLVDGMSDHCPSCGQELEFGHDRMTGMATEGCTRCGWARPTALRFLGPRQEYTDEQLALRRGELVVETRPLGLPQRPTRVERPRVVVPPMPGPTRARRVRTMLPAVPRPLRNRHGSPDDARARGRATQWGETPPGRARRALVAQFGETMLATLDGPALLAHVGPDASTAVRLAVLMGARRCTQPDVAAVAGVTAAAVYGWLARGSVPQRDVAARVAAHFGVEVTALWGARVLAAPSLRTPTGARPRKPTPKEQRAAARQVPRTCQHPGCGAVFTPALRTGRIPHHCPTHSTLYWINWRAVQRKGARRTQERVA